MTTRTLASAALLLDLADVATAAPATAATGAVRWPTTPGGAVDSSPSFSKGIVYVGSDDATVHALDARTRSRDDDHREGHG